MAQTEKKQRGGTPVLRLGMAVGFLAAVLAALVIALTHQFALEWRGFTALSCALGVMIIADRFLGRR